MGRTPVYNTCLKMDRILVVVTAAMTGLTTSLWQLNYHKHIHMRTHTSTSTTSRMWCWTFQSAALRKRKANTLSLQSNRPPGPQNGPHWCFSGPKEYNFTTVTRLIKSWTIWNESWNYDPINQVNLECANMTFNLQQAWFAHVYIQILTNEFQLTKSPNINV